MLRVFTRPDEFDARCCPLLKHNTPFITSERQADSDSFVNAKAIECSTRGVKRTDIHPTFKSSENPNRSTRQSLFQLPIKYASYPIITMLSSPENSGKAAYPPSRLQIMFPDWNEVAFKLLPRKCFVLNRESLTRYTFTSHLLTYLCHRRTRAFINEALFRVPSFRIAKFSYRNFRWKCIHHIWFSFLIFYNYVLYCT